jgi:uncharacterized protein YihD (DUF1040 family)
LTKPSKVIKKTVKLAVEAGFKEAEKKFTQEVLNFHRQRLSQEKLIQPGEDDVA